MTEKQKAKIKKCIDEFCATYDTNSNNRKIDLPQNQYAKPNRNTYKYYYCVVTIKINDNGIDTIGIDSVSRSHSTVLTNLFSEKMIGLPSQIKEDLMYDVEKDENALNYYTTDIRYINVANILFDHDAMKKMYIAERKAYSTNDIFLIRLKVDSINILNKSIKVYPYGIVPITRVEILENIKHNNVDLYDYSTGEINPTSYEYKTIENKYISDYPNINPTNPDVKFMNAIGKITFDIKERKDYNNNKLTLYTSYSTDVNPIIYQSMIEYVFNRCFTDKYKKYYNDHIMMFRRMFFCIPAISKLYASVATYEVLDRSTLEPTDIKYEGSNPSDAIAKIIFGLMKAVYKYEKEDKEEIK